MSDDRDRVSQLIDFLGDLDARRNPPVYDIRRYGLYLVREADLPHENGAVRLTPHADAWLTADFAELPEPLVLPSELVGVIASEDARNPDQQPQIVLNRDTEASSENELSADDEQLLERARGWIDEEWTTWSEEYKSALVARTFYRDLFELRETVKNEREAVELVWGFGRLCWSVDVGTVEPVQVDHPLLTVPVEIDLDRATGRISVHRDGAIAVDRSWAANLPISDRAGMRNTAELVEVQGVDPWSDLELTNVTEMLVRAVDHEDRGVAVTPEWVLYLRRKRPDYQGFLDRMRALYRDGQCPIPDALRAVVSSAPSTIGGDGSWSPDVINSSWNAAEDIRLLLPLPTNEEQQRIVRYAQSRSGVTAQGPPGTGKSHTIANIISHYLAQGRRVLVVSEKEQALRSLVGKIPEDIRGLTVSVLGADRDSRRDLESSIKQIQSKVTGIDKAYADQRIKTLRDSLDVIDRRIALVTSQLLGTREAEVTRLPGRWDAGEDPTRAEAARWVTDREGELGYIDDLIEPTTPVPLASGELAELTSLIARVGFERAAASAQPMPDPQRLPDAAWLSAANSRAAEIQLLLDGAAPHVQSWEQVGAADTGAFVGLAERCGQVRDWLRSIGGDWRGAVRAQLADRLLAGSWHQFVQAAQQERSRIMYLRGVLAAHTVVVPADPDPQLLRLLNEARRQLATSGKIGAFSREVKRALGECRVDGQPAATAPDVELCFGQLELEALRRSLATRWANTAAGVSGPAIETRAAPEDSIGQCLDIVNTILNYPAWAAALRSDLTATGVRATQPDTPEGFGELAQVCSTLALREEREALLADVARLSAYLDDGCRLPQASPAWADLRAALAGLDFAAWAHVQDGVLELQALSRDAQRLTQLYQRLVECAPIWASRIAADPAAAGEPARLASAWQWRALDTWVRESLDGRSPTQLQSELEELAARRRRVIGDLVAELAWRRLADNLGDRQRQALNSYLKAVTRFGKTGGKYAARWLAEMRTALNESKDAVPVWIMTKDRALNSFRPELTAPFDVLVIDEASQIGLEAVPLFSLARTAIVVGDDQQTSPENVGLDRQAVFNLLDEHLADVPKYRTLFDPENSLYDLANQKFPDIVVLKEHFRSLPEIIEFSNSHFYSHTIVPLRDRRPRPDWQALGTIAVPDGYRRGDVNEPEARAVVDLIERLCADPDYTDMDFGVISLLGTSQAKLIWDLLFDRLGQAELERRRLRCGEAANFQGDERDVMVLSLVAATDPENPQGRIGALANAGAHRRINVAASRARNQMWVVHSLEPDRFSQGDLRGDLIRHCANPPALAAEQVADLAARCDSPFEQEVVKAIVARGYRRVRVQHIVGRFRIDIVVEGPESRLAVECDGDRWHGPDEWHRDRARQEVLERAGWTFERIRGSAYYRNRAEALEPLWRRLDELGIPTGDAWLSEPLHSKAIEPVAEVGQPEVPSAETLSEDASTDEEPTRTYPHGGHASSVREFEPAEAMDDQDEGTARSAVSLEPQPSWNAAVLPSPQGQISEGIAAVLAPHIGWIMRTQPPVGVAEAAELIGGMTEIVAAEGPVLGRRLFQIYVKASGGHRVGKDIHRVLSDATRLAVRTGRLAWLDDDEADVAGKTLFEPGTAPVAVRQLGDRQLTDVPRSEVAALADALRSQGQAGTDIKRAILDIYGLVRMTSGVSKYLDDCFAYEYRLR